MRRGASSIIATVLLILMVVAVLMGVFIWMQNYLFKTSQEANVDKLCSGVLFTAADFCSETLLVPNIQTGQTEPRERLILSVENNMNYPIDGFLLSLRYNDGSSAPLSVLSGQVNASQIKKLTTDFIASTDNINEIKVMPQVIVGNNTLTCNSNAQTFKWSGVKQC
ncbi:MAG: hypothetical protein M1165_00290 [Candidatus Pacearchaeota archaeon]|nr:hypothetical protein [Candidatus Pacearchaeota archaeon]MDE1848576.1 hypothetical protein [Nanoarchaeota archaeon]